MLDSSANGKNYVIFGSEEDEISTAASTTDSSFLMCTVGEVVQQFIGWSPEIYNLWNSIDYMNHDPSPGALHRCPTYADIRNSTSLSVTLYRDTSIDGNTGEVTFKNSSTYKFNGEVGQLPRLKLVGQYAVDRQYEDSFTDNYNSKSLVRLRDILGIYVPKTITFRIKSFSLSATNGAAFSFQPINYAGSTISSNRYEADEFYVEQMTPVFVSATVSASPQEYVFETTELLYGKIGATGISFMLKEQYIEDSINYVSGSYTYTVIRDGVKDESKSFVPGSAIYSKITDISDDIIIELNATVKTLNTVSVSSEEGHLVMQVATNPNGLTVSSKQYKTVLTALETYGIVSTTYYDPSTLNYRISIDDPSAYPKFEFLLTYYYNDGTVADVSSMCIYSDNIVSASTWRLSGGYFYLPVIQFTENTYNVTLWLDAKEAYQPRTVTIVTYTSGIEYTVDDTTATLVDGYTNRYHTLESANGIISITCSKLPDSTEQTNVQGWYYRVSTNRSARSSTYSTGTYVDIEVPKDMTVYLYVSTVATVKIMLRKSGYVSVYNNITDQTLSDDTYFYTTADSYNTTIDLKISTGIQVSGATKVDTSVLINGDVSFVVSGGSFAPALYSTAKYNPFSQIINSLKSNDKFDIQLESSTNGVSTVVDSSKGIKFNTLGNNYKYTGLSTNSNVEYILDVSAYDEYITKTVSFYMTHSTDISIYMTSDNLTFNGKTLYQSSDVNGTADGYKYTYTMSSDTTISAKFGITSGDTGKYQYMTGLVSVYDDDTLVPVTTTLDTMGFDGDGMYTLSLSGSSLSTSFSSATIVDVSLFATSTTLYSYHVIGDGKMQISVYKDNFSDPTDASALPVSTNDCLVSTTYMHPKEYRLKLECDDEFYNYYSYMLYDNDDILNPIDTSIVEFNKYLDSDGTYYNFYDSSKGLFDVYGDGTYIVFNAILDMLLYWRSIDKPLMVTPRSTGTRPIGIRGITFDE